MGCFLSNVKERERDRPSGSASDRPSAQRKQAAYAATTTKKKGPRIARALFVDRHRCGFPGGFSDLKTSRLIWMYSRMLPGTSSSGKIAVTGHSGSHAPQSMHSSG